ncbi:MAG TPA: cyanophycin synthetase, partial [bacterium]|nr:cyanophycin synthetase [bacterium]
LKMLGAHHVYNALAAAAVGAVLEVPTEEIVAGLEARFHPVPGRGDVRMLAGNVVLFDDTYNANPTSTSAALAALDASRKAGRTRAVALLGDMLELGDLGPDAHARIGAEAARLMIDALYLFGPLSRKTADAALAAGLKNVKHFDSRDALADGVLADLKSGDGVLAKGSRGMKMDEVVAKIVATRGMA